jgi:hypothetical protein
MSGFRRLVIVLMLLWIVLLVVHPAVDLPHTVLRTGQLLSFMLVICSSVLAVAARDALRPRCSVLCRVAARPFSACCSLLEKNCIQRC